MRPELLLTAILLLAPQSNTPGGQHGPLRNTFLIASETVVDNAATINPDAPDAQYDPLFHQLKQSQTTLTTLAEDDREQEIATESNNLIFTISACHLQAQADASKVTVCKAQVNTSIRYMMSLINHHKQKNTWIPGPPL